MEQITAYRLQTIERIIFVIKNGLSRSGDLKISAEAREVRDGFTLQEDIKQEASPYYAGPIEHLIDLMKRQDLLVQREVKRMRKGRVKFDAWAQFAAISEEEVEDLLRQDGQRRHASEQPQEEIEINSKLADMDKRIEERVRAGITAGIHLPLPALSRIFGLSPVETNVLISCFAPEIDGRYERIYSYLHDDMTRRRASTRLALAFCCGSRQEEIRARQIFSLNAPLMKYQLLHFVDEIPGSNPFLSQALRIDRRIASFLLGEKGFDAGIQDAFHRAVPDAVSEYRASIHQEAVDRVLRARETYAGNNRPAKKMLFYLHGSPTAGSGGVVREVSGRLGIPLLVVDPSRIPARTTGLDTALFQAFREALLCQSLIYIRDFDKILEQDHDTTRLTSLLRNIEEMGSITFLSGEKAWSPQIPAGQVIFLPVELRALEYAEQMDLWKKELRGASALDDKTLSFIVSKYPSSPEQIKDSAAAAETSAALRGGNALISAADIEQAIRATCIPNFGNLARKMKTRATLHDIILPSIQQAQLREICNHVRYKSVVYGTWGFDRKLPCRKGLTALFSGPPGAGKTMAAEVIAKELELDLFKIDLPHVVSKCIGETEKNLHQIFREAQAGHTILFFDDADALLGKRADVKDAHERRANLETEYLLEKMEEYEGITILASNLKQNMDDALTRRMRFLVDFPFPDEECRLRIWQGIWPKETPLSENVDLSFMAKRFKLTGGAIGTIALAAAFLASSAGDRIEMNNVLIATRQELLKMGRLADESEFVQS